jgi:microsomal dipeptidase-like Zn-dependent dipeptidase
MVAKAVDIMGIDHVGIGTDRSHNFTKPDYDWMRMGRWTRGVDYGAASAARPGKAPPPAWFQEVHHLGLLPAGLREVGFAAAEVEKIANGNWLRLYREVFGVAERIDGATIGFVQTDPVLATTPRAVAP